MKRIVFLGFWLLSAASSWADAQKPFDVIRQWVVQENGRIKPVDTFARETIRLIAGKESFVPADCPAQLGKTLSGDPVDTLLSMMFQSEKWEDIQTIKVSSKPLKTLLGLPLEKKYFSLAELRKCKELESLIDKVMEKRHAGEKKLSETERNCEDLSEKMGALQSLSSIEKNIALIPPAKPAEVAEESSWLSLSQFSTTSSPQAKKLTEDFTLLSEAYEKGDLASFQSLASSIGTTLREISPSNYLTQSKIDLEIHYNRLKPAKKAFMLYFLAVFFWLLALALNRKSITAVAWLISCIGLFLHTYSFVLRAILSGNAPVANMYESMTFMAWGIIAFGLLFEGIYRTKYIGLSSSLTSGIVLLMANVLPIDSSVGVIVPVLRSNFWLIIHVMTIMLSYSALAMAWALGHVCLGKLIANPKGIAEIRPISMFIYRTLQAGVLLLAAGIILGSMWANISWGRYWGWDPKETWSLICLLVYLAVLHARRTNWIGNFGMAISSVLAFMLVVMCYYGVNFLMSKGLHAYGSGSGGAQYALAYVVLDLFFCLVAVLRVRTGRTRTPQ